jgi:hypothetical protein
VIGFDTTVSVENILTGVAILGGLLRALHVFNRRIDERHAQNVRRMDTLDASNERIESKLETQEKKLDTGLHELGKLSSDFHTHDALDERRFDELERWRRRTENGHK